MNKITFIMCLAIAAMTFGASAQDNLQVAVFDFNAMDPESTPFSIDEDLVMTEGGITMTVTSNPNYVPAYFNQNRFTTNYANLVQLQMFGGTMTLEASGDITQLTIYKQQWAYANNIDGEQLIGENYTYAPRYWYGEQPTVVLNIANNTQFNRVEVTYTPSGSTSIDEVSASNVVSESYYDLQGRQVDASASGIVIRKTILSDGKALTSKELR